MNTETSRKKITLPLFNVLPYIEDRSYGKVDVKTSFLKKWGSDHV